jgi:hypothetical protein
LKTSKIALKLSREYIERVVNPYDVACQLVGKDMLIRKNDQSINLGALVVGACLVIGVPYFWISGINKSVEEMNRKAEESKILMGVITRTPEVINMAQSVPGYLSTVQPSPTITMQVTATPYPTYTPVPTEELKIRILKLSFYDPLIGVYFPDIAEVNCSEWNYVTNNCDSLMSGGEDFRDWYGKAVACPPGMETGKVIQVLFPEELRGEWICADRGGVIEGDWIDFLLKYPDQVWTGYNLNNFPWGSTVVIKE